MPTKVSNPRDLVLLVLGDLLFVERRLAAQVLPELIAQVAANVVDPKLRDLFHAHAALHTEHYELAGYDALLRLAPDLDELLAPSRDDERHAARALEQALERLAKGARAR